jgi:hypothetical protein
MAAASRAKPTGREKVTMDTSVPARSVLALPIGNTKLGDSASSDISNSTPYLCSISM